MEIAASSLDDLMKLALEAIIMQGEHIDASRGANTEIRAVLLTLSDPRARLSHSEKKGKMFSPLGELAWYLSESNSSDFICYYIQHYKRDTETDGSIHGAYGPRIFSSTWNDQFNNVIKLLKEKPSSRRAVIQLFDSTDLPSGAKEVPCTCSLQFLVRNSCLDMIASMRSNDAFKGLPHDVFSFTMLQEIVARSLGYEPGKYFHFTGSLHLYDENKQDAEVYLKEGWQESVDIAMPPMPLGDPSSSIKVWLSAEEAIRTNLDPNQAIGSLDDYWQDLVRLLQVYKYSRGKDLAGISNIKQQMVSPVYREYITAREQRLSN